MDVDPEDYYGMMTNTDAHGDSLVQSPKLQAYLSQVTVTDNITLSQEIIEPGTYAQVVSPSNKFHKSWHFADEKELIFLTKNNT